MIERMTGTDAVMLHMDRSDTPMHTLKTVVLDWSHRGQPIRLDEVASELEGLLGLLPRLRQKVQAAPGFPGRPFWVTDPDLDIHEHLDEVEAEPPGDRRTLDAIHSRLAATHVERDKPLWGITLVHGLADHRQAIVTRLHHAIVDGGGALNGLLAVSSPEPGHRPHVPDPQEAREVSGAELRAEVVRQAPQLVTGLVPLVVDAVKVARKKWAYQRDHPDLPRIPSGPHNFATAIHDDSRVCASIDLPLDTVKRVAKGAGVTVNGVYHALIAAAFRDELLAHGDDPSRRVIATFGMASDDGNPLRLSGNHVTPTFARLGVEESDPRRRLEVTASNCARAVERQRLGDLGATDRWADYYCRVAPWFARTARQMLPRIPTHLVTANVKGPDHRRWADDLLITDWISYAVVANPGNLNITAHSYDDRLVVGMMVGHGVLPDPYPFLDRMRSELDVLAES